MSTNKPQPKYGLASVSEAPVSPPMTFTSPRATLPELLQFANAVREAGGGNPLDALMPSVPEDSSQCLIAKNLNFNCSVDATGRGGAWIMIIDNADIAERIAAKLGLEFHDEDDGNSLILPPEIGEVAAAFDEWAEGVFFNDDEVPVIDPNERPERIARFKEFWPYVDEAIKEAYANATFVNDKGELVL